eukprot:g3193.t1
MPVVNIIGEIRCARNFQERNLFCKYTFVHDSIASFHDRIAAFDPEAEVSEKISNNLPNEKRGEKKNQNDENPFRASSQLWSVLDGKVSGQTQLDTKSHDVVEDAIWNHPVDVQYSCIGLRGWPKLRLEIWFQDTHLRANLLGYTYVNIPFQPGSHVLVAKAWRLQGSWYHQLASRFLGNTMHLTDPSVVVSPVNRESLQSHYVGDIEVQLDVLIKGFKNQGVILTES